MKTRFISILLMTGLLLPFSAPAESEVSLPTQRQWMVNLVTAMGWSSGLPDTPQDQDYLTILDGHRQLRVEGETAFQPTDSVSVKHFETFGNYSGKGWLSGLADSTKAHLRFLLPLGGTYRISVAVRLPGHQISINGKTFTADGGTDFTRVELGQVQLAAGEQEVLIQLPPDGGFDYLELQAPDLPRIAPLTGWQPEQPVSLDVLAITAIQVLDLEPLLPPRPEQIIVEAETAGKANTLQVTDIRHFGLPSGGKWLRATTAPTEVRIDFTPPAPGIYALSIRAKAETPITARLNDGRWLEAAPAAFLQDLPLGSAYLQEGHNLLTLTIPPRGGIDCLKISGQSSDGRDFRRLIGLPLVGTYPTADQIDHLLALLVAIGSPR